MYTYLRNSRVVSVSGIIRVHRWKLWSWIYMIQSKSCSPIILIFSWNTLTSGCICYIVPEKRWWNYSSTVMFKFWAKSCWETLVITFCFVAKTTEDQAHPHMATYVCSCWANVHVCHLCLYILADKWLRGGVNWKLVFRYWISIIRIWWHFRVCPNDQLLF